MAAENERPCGQPSVSTCVLLCLFASLPLYLCACSNVCLCNCVLARLQVQVLGQQCALVYFCSCLLAILGQPSVNTCVHVRLFACVPLYLCASFLQVQLLGQPSVTTFVLLRFFASVPVYLRAYK